MPELPEVETVVRGLAPTLTGATLQAVEQNRAGLRFPFPEDFAARLTGRIIGGVRRRAKYILADLDDGVVLAMHLGMTGSFRIERAELEATPGGYYHERSRDTRHDHVVLHLGDGARVTYNDPRRFGFMTLVASEALADHPLFRHIGVEPLGPDFDAVVLATLLHRKAAPLKAALLDQTLIAGLGNIYVCEALHRSGLSPRRAAGTLVRADGRPTPRAVTLAAAIRAVLEDAILAGGSTLRDYRRPDQTLGTFQHGFRAYDREGAACCTPGCAGTIARIVQSGRSTFFCAACQR
ncbi:bifunctional DNA-formamidopyrimidine glycosylase/DNA-(apurinic or apyrimidinic site) lyase [Lichenihabitans sp. Uapishka_5]|uniref:bifunctional DNA-formamidopyrimidine glycosylase/DNA-(apurinic or apyrimidinic site) lyase n=1 Tax=Lichenihabitans sp. Uapishka_5 TaxID=3037302 RepID=UPI0029E7CB78|nr:bifunctional DNA-formamidopyrimidine glycosylase/DNA-(apurinic or apyrimidinic site) lyase [Lichenihabitans sp. Uapishka_5]MDX7950121.1 bifunctional DNA-formamidopyrimidine glycosylase/DNA-(apurinic or apyrimidinic site) lyase [Lichenihabitans sp. Uapishka_5]